jgi:hypothetical protein
MSFTNAVILGAIAALLFAAVVAVVTVVVTKKVRELKADRKLKKIKGVIKAMKPGEEFIFEVGKNIMIEGKDFCVTCVHVGSEMYDSVKEALEYESISKFRRKQIFKIENLIDEAYKLNTVQVVKVQEVKQEIAVEQQETRKEKFYTMIDTGKDMDGEVYIYRATDFVVSTHLKAEVVQDKETGYLEIACIWYAPEGNVSAPKALIPFDVRTAKGNKAYTHYIENNPKFYQETENLKKIMKRLDKYNQILEEGRIKQDKNGVYYIEAPEPKEEELKQEEQNQEEPKQETPKEQVNAEFEKEEPKKEEVTVDQLI